MDIKIADIEFIKKRKFIVTTKKKEPISINIENVYIPFGVEEYNDKRILNIVLLNEDNKIYNIYSKLVSIEEYIEKQDIKADFDVTQAIIQKSFMSTIKETYNGHIIRTHISNPNIYIINKEGEKLPIDINDISKSYVDAKIVLNGIWYTNNTYGLFWTTTDISIKKFTT